MKANSEELKRLRLAHARWRVEVAQGALIAHRHAGRAARTYHWKVADGRHSQHLEVAQTHLRILVCETQGSAAAPLSVTRRFGHGIRGYLKRKLSSITGRTLGGGEARSRAGEDTPTATRVTSNESRR